MTPKQLNILRHSLGLDDHGIGRQYRNRFVTGPGSTDWGDCKSLVQQGLMSERANVTVFGGDSCFWVTDSGKAAVNAATPVPEKVSRGRRRYLTYIRGPWSMTFGEWLKTRWAKEACQ